MTNERKKKPSDETQTGFDLPVEGTTPPVRNDEPEIEVRLPDPPTETSFELPPEETDPEPQATEPFEEPVDTATETDVGDGLAADDVLGDAPAPQAEVVAPAPAEPPTETSFEDEDPPTETRVLDGATQTEFGALLPPGPTEEPPDPSDPPTMTDVFPDGVEALKSLVRRPDETDTGVADPTATSFFPDDEDTADGDEDPADPDRQPTATALFDDDVDTADFEEDADPHDQPTATLGAPGVDDEAPTCDLPPREATTGELDETRSLPDALQEISTGSPATPAGLPPAAPRFEAVHVEVPGGAFIDTFFERPADDEADEDRRGAAPTSSRGWRERLERAKPSPWRDLGLWFVRRADPRAFWQRLKTRRRRSSGEEPTNKQVAKDAARAIASFVASVAKPRAEIAAEHNKSWWRRTIVEIAALFLMVVPVEVSLTGSIGSFGAHPHPYWLIVIPMACARGVVAGLLAAGIASLLYAAGAVGALQAPELSSIFNFGDMLEPILFFVVGFFCGELHDELASRYRKLERRMEDVQERNQSLRQERDVLRDANRELEKRIVDASVQFGNIIVAAERIENSGRMEVFDIALELVEEHCGAAASVVLLLEDGTLDYVTWRGWDEEQVAERLSFVRDSRIVRLAIAEGRMVNGFSDEEETPPDGPLVVAPLFDRSGLVKAMLCLDDVPATRLNESTITTFLGIARWIGSALTRLSDAERRNDPLLSAPVITVPANRLGTCDELGARLRLELERCARYGVPASFLAIQLSSWTDASREGVVAADRFVAEHFTTGLRPSDNIFRFGYPGCYLLVLGGTDVAGAEIVRTRLLRRVEHIASQAVGPVEIFASGPDADAPDLVSLAERVARRFRELSPMPLEGACPVIVPERGEPGTAAELHERLRMETSLAVRNEFPLHLVGFRTAARDVAVGVTLARHLSEVGVRLLRATDGVYLAAENCTVVVMPSTGEPEAQVLADRLIQALLIRDPGAPYGMLDPRIVGLGGEYPDTYSLLAALGLEPSREGAS